MVFPKAGNYCHLPLGGGTVRYSVLRNEFSVRGQKPLKESDLIASLAFLPVGEGGVFI